MNDIEKFKDNLSNQLFGRSRILAIAGKSCVSCGSTAVWFRDKISEREYQISGLCQKCQDRFFCESIEDEA